MIDAYLKSKADLDDRAIHLLFSANRWEKKAELLSLLNKGTTVVVDRYAFSGVAFSGSKDKLSLEWCRNSDRGLPKPDAVIFLDISVEDASKRGEFGAERYEKVRFAPPKSCPLLLLWILGPFVIIDRGKGLSSHPD